MIDSKDDKKEHENSKDNKSKAEKMLADERISSGSEVIDKLLDGGYEKSCITTIYGPAGAGKTNQTILCTISQLKKGKKVIFVDTDGGFSFSRFKQLSPSPELVSGIIFFRPINFGEQKKAFEDIKKIVNDLEDKIGIIIVDSIAMLYRLELGKSNDVYGVNKDLGIQLAYLIETARTKNIPVLITNQVYADINNKEQIHMVGGDLLRYSSKCLIELRKYQGNVRSATLRKHRSLPERKEIWFKIQQNCIEEYKQDMI